jgi:hypothetical protein
MVWSLQYAVPELQSFNPSNRIGTLVASATHRWKNIKCLSMCVVGRCSSRLQTLQTLQHYVDNCERPCIIHGSSILQPFNTSTLQTFNPSTLQPFKPSTLQPFYHSLPPFNPSTLPVVKPSTLQPLNSSSLQPFKISIPSTLQPFNPSFLPFKLSNLQSFNPQS